MIVAGGLHIETIASIAHARELAALPNGDLLVGTSSSTVYLVPNAEAAANAGAPIVFATMPDADAAGVAFDRSSCTVFVGTTAGVYATPYRDGDTSAEKITKIASVRTSSSGGHSTTSVAVANGNGVCKRRLFMQRVHGNGPNARNDPTDAARRSSMTSRAVHIRNAIALAVNPQSNHLWAGDAGQDDLPTGHPYEFFDDVSSHAGVADYGWPQCEENHRAYGSGANCTNTVEPLVELPAYSTIIGAVFYPSSASGAYALPATYRGGAFLAAHGSWHEVNGSYFAVPQVVFVPMNGDAPQTTVNWSDPTKQWKAFVTGFQSSGTTRIGRPTGLADRFSGQLVYSGRHGRSALSCSPVVFSRLH